MTATYTLNYGSGSTSVSGIGKVRVKDSNLWLHDGAGDVMAVLPLSALRALWRTDVAADEADDDVLLIVDYYAALATTADTVARVSGVKRIDTYADPANNNRVMLILETDDDDLPAGVVYHYYAVRRDGLVP